MKLKDKIIIITGASDVIGKEIALRLAREKVKLALIGRNEKRLNEVGKITKKLGAIDTKTYVCDIRKIDEVEDIIRTITNDFGSIDILINNAGIWQKLRILEEINKEDIDEIIETNLLSLIQFTRLALTILKNKKEAAIINVVSKSGIVGQELQSVYTASKYGVRGFTESLKAELKGSRIRIAGIYQSGTDTKMFEKTGENFSTDRFTNPADLADVISYMLSLPPKIWLYDVRVEY